MIQIDTLIWQRFSLVHINLGGQEEKVSNLITSKANSLRFTLARVSRSFALMADVSAPLFPAKAAIWKAY